MQTSDPAIYAVGDAVEVTDFVSGASRLIPLAGPANRQGRIAADNICGRDSAYRKTQGTAICKVFDLAVGHDRHERKTLKRTEHRRMKKSTSIPPAMPAIIPAPCQMSLKLLFDPDTGKMLGAQAVGIDGVDKRIDVIAVAIRAGLTVMTCRTWSCATPRPTARPKTRSTTPALSPPMSCSGDMPICHAADVLDPRRQPTAAGCSHPHEVQAGTIPGA